MEAYSGFFVFQCGECRASYYEPTPVEEYFQEVERLKDTQYRPVLATTCPDCGAKHKFTP